MKAPTSLLANYVSMLWHVMALTGKGYRKHSLKHTGKGDDRRNDKLQAVNAPDDDPSNPGGYKVKHVPFDVPESKITRAARLKTLTL